MDSIRKQRCVTIYLLCLVLCLTLRPCFSGLCASDGYFGDRDYDQNDNEESNTGKGYLMSDTDLVIDCCGVVEKWKARFIDRGDVNRDISFQIWRLASGSTYTLVGENTFTITADGNRDSITVPVAERITVKPNDKFGWWTSGTDLIPYDLGGVSDNWLLDISDLSAGDTQDWSAKTNKNWRRYAIRGDLEPNNMPTFSNLPGTGSISNAVGSGLSLITITVSDVDTSDISTLAVTMRVNSQFSFDISTLELTTATISGNARTEILVFDCVDQCGNTASATFTVIITNDPPIINNLPNTTIISEDTTLETTLHIIDVTDPGDTVTCAMATSVPASYPFTVKLVPGSINYGIFSDSTPGFDYDVKSSYTLTIDCSDSDNTVSGAYSVGLIRNSPPVIVNLQNSTSVDTSASIGDVAFSVITTDAEGDALAYSMTCSPTPCPFQIYSSGNILVTEYLASHTTPAYDLYITVADDRGSDGPETLSITITGINDPVTITNLPNTLSVSENTALGISVYAVSYSDLDTSQTHTFSMTSSPSNGISFFSINASSGLVSTDGSVLNYENLGGAYTFTFTVTVTDTVSSDTDVLTVQVVDVNESPSFNPSAYGLTGDEGQAGDIVGTPVYAYTDPDAGDSHTLSMDCGSSNTYLYINSTSGLIRYQTDYDVDAGTLPTSITCNVTVTDSGGLTDAASLLITIDNVNDNAPIFFPTTYVFHTSPYVSTGTTVGTTTAYDNDLGTYGDLAYRLDQASLGDNYFAIDGSGVISINNNLNYSSSYVFNAIVEDTGGLEATATVTVIVSDTTTVATTTVGYEYRKFWDNPYTWAWFIPLVLTILAIMVLSCWLALTCHGKQGCGPTWSRLCEKRAVKVYKPNKQGMQPGVDDDPIAGSSNMYGSHLKLQDIIPGGSPAEEATFYNV